jgi:hypothetical protein
MWVRFGCRNRWSSLVEPGVENFSGHYLKSRGDRDGHERSDDAEQRAADQNGDDRDEAGTFTTRPMILGTSR